MTTVPLSVIPAQHSAGIQPFGSKGSHSRQGGLDSRPGLLNDSGSTLEL